MSVGSVTSSTRRVYSWNQTLFIFLPVLVSDADVHMEEDPPAAGNQHNQQNPENRAENCMGERHTVNRFPSCSLI